MPETQDDIFYRAMLARDHRFDGKFFVAVKTTGIYCRPICPAKPHRRNLEFFLTAAAAEREGYRPCLRCRPECAPQSPGWLGTSAVVQQGLKLIAADDRLGVDENQFAARLGVTARHLRRLFVAEVGQTPKQVSDNNRLNFARRLVVETNLPLIAVADSAGFASLRRFNSAFLQRFHRSPSQLRRPTGSRATGSRAAGSSNPASVDHRAITLRLAYRPPFDWHWLNRFYRRHALPGIETITDNEYARVFQVGKTIGWMSAAPDPSGHSIQLRVVADDPAILLEIVRRTRRMFDLDCDPLLIASAFDSNRFLQELCTTHPGLRLPLGWDPFESAVGAILGQFVSVEYAVAMMGQLVRNYGQPATHPLTGEPIKLFPTPEVVADADLLHVKTTGVRRQTLRTLARHIADGTIQLSTTQDPHAFRESLLNIHGIGPWSAHYMSLRCIGDTDAFPATDLILRRALERLPDLDLPSLAPWRGYAAMYLWKHFASVLSRPKKSVDLAPASIEIATSSAELATQETIAC
jgi:AraC family transcriptional regulator, regulatory protein of adaptative response / DNA-3-methyladenine glycosylase II